MATSSSLFFLPTIPALLSSKVATMKNNVRIQRVIRNMTQEELARKVGVTRQTINAIEKGKYNPSLELAFKLAKLFDMKIEELFFYGGDEDEQAD
jgi:putative transcriptional regulator